MESYLIQINKTSKIFFRKILTNISLVFIISLALTILNATLIKSHGLFASVLMGATMISLGIILFLGIILKMYELFKILYEIGRYITRGILFISKIVKKYS